ncbi:hypothetical protein ACOMHN_022252 [Nucella lapillus]
MHAKTTGRPSSWRKASANVLRESAACPRVQEGEGRVVEAALPVQAPTQRHKYLNVPQVYTWRGHSTMQSREPAGARQPVVKPTKSPRQPQTAEDVAEAPHIARKEGFVPPWASLGLSGRRGVYVGTQIAVTPYSCSHTILLQSHHPPPAVTPSSSCSHTILTAVTLSSCSHTILLLQLHPPPPPPAVTPSSCSHTILLQSHPPPAVIPSSSCSHTILLLQSHHPPPAVTPSSSCSHTILLQSHHPPPAVTPSSSCSHTILLLQSHHPPAVTPSSSYSQTILLQSHHPPPTVKPFSCSHTILLLQ